ncbi:MAG: hypothetical protein GTN35_05605 [Nitrososphaeria archaeon]|nr:hypothetical protein [Nitrosopumilaceae archaeon]NIP09827.1 hypothetical protein [Nitrosopumilaceae archaeon]NIP91851.1 hypothetical protein [Nitrososphaeria archaeon]NIS95910.1 hypothetical protein [Nitrosopumilaceae archaeon]
MNLLFVFSIVLLVLVPPAVFAVADIENQTVVAQSKGGEIILSLEFGENQISRFNKMIPTFQSGSLIVGDSIIEIVDARAKFMGNSFVVHSDDILIYAKSMGEQGFQINSYLLGGNQLDAIKLTSVSMDEEEIIAENDSQKIETIVLVQQDIRTFWNDNYDIEIKVFDKAINPKPQFYQSFGAIENANIQVTLKDLEGNQLTQFTGQTNSRGFWEGDYFVLQNLVVGGTYLVEVNVDYLDSNNFQQLETLIVSDTRASDSSN